MPNLDGPPPEGKSLPKYSDYIKKRTTPGDPKTTFLDLKDLELGRVCEVLGRESWRSQKKNLPEQLTRVRQATLRQGGIIDQEFGSINPGWDSQHLYLAVQRALEVGGVIVAESVDRLVRSRDYHPVTNPNAVPFVADLEELKRNTCGIPLYVVESLTNSPGENRAGQTKRGLQAKQGKPSMTKDRYKKRRESLIKRILKLYEQGKSTGMISQILERETEYYVPSQTVWRWIKEEGF